MSFLLYGSYGYTGRLIAKRAMEVGLRPMLAGRNGEEVRRQAEALDLRHRVVDLDDSGALDRALGEVPVVLHAAGPFVHTARPMAEGCLRTGTHYLDITGELQVFEAMAARDAQARDAAVMLLPGVGFDVVPSDCLAAHLKSRLPSATHLALAFEGLGGISRGTATTMVENLGRGGAVRQEGRITPVPAAWKTRTIDFGDGPVEVTTIPWGDVSTAYYSTGIPNVEVYTRMPPSSRRMLVASRYLGWLFQSDPAQRWLKKRVQSRPAGPSEARRARGASHLWGQVADPQGRSAVSRLYTPEGYTLTALTAVAAVQRVLDGKAPVGFQTPSAAYGADFILEIEGVRREDVA